jgi:hypothetical protein
MSLRITTASADGIKRSGYPGGPAEGSDAYMGRLVKLVPAEAVTVYPLLVSQAQSATGPNRMLVYVTAWVLLLVVIVLRWKATSVPGKGAQWGSVLIAAVAFFIWVHVMGGDFGFEMLMQKAAAPPPGTRAGAAVAQAAAEARAPAPIDATFASMKSYLSNLALTTWTLVAPAIYKGEEES